MGKLNEKGLKGLLTKPPGRYPDGDGLHFKTIGKGRAYFTYRFMLKGRERELSIGPYPETSLEAARIKHKRFVADVAAGIDPAAERKAVRAAIAAKAEYAPSVAPTFGQCADAYLKAHDAGWKNPKHSQQWAMTLTNYAKPLRDMPVDQVDTAAILGVLTPIWNKTPETASRLRGRIEAVLASAQVDGWIEEGRSNPARWKNWLDHKLAPPKKIGTRGHHTAMDYKLVPAFMARLAETPGVAALALRLTILTACRTSEVLNMTFDEIDFENAIWRIPASRMKMGKPHDVPLSPPALAILKAQHETRGRNPHVFPGRPTKPLSNMALNMLLRRLKVPVTTHGFRSSARSWMADQGVQFELAEAALAHTVGSAVVQAYQRSSMLERRRPVLASWAQFVCGTDADNDVVPMKLVTA
jgi:integrase